MSGITTHVLDTAAGRPAAGLGVTLEAATAAGTWEERSRKATGADGRIADFGLGERPAAGIYRLRFATAAYFARQGVASLYPEVTVAFTLANPEEHYHIPLLLSPYGYSTYRGS
jgi:5-hydroxyisourate hydrolase